MRALLLLLAAAWAIPALAQPEVVPADHAVYPFLLDQRIAGHVPTYRHEVLPLSRTEVLRHLDTLDARRDALPPGTRRWTDAFRRELAPETRDVHAWIGDGEARATDLGAERYLAFSRSDDGEFRIAGVGRAQYRRSEGPNTLGEPLESASGAALVPELVISGHWRDVIGVYSGTTNGLQVTGDTRVLRADPELASLYYVDLGSGFGEAPPGSFDRTSASLRFVGGPFSAEIANERLRIGPSPAQPLVMAEGADYFPFVRAGFEAGPFRYQFVHGALGDRSRFVNEPDDLGLRGPERYLALHRVEAHIALASVAFSEMVIYGLRGPELAYLNPLFPIKPAEHALWDRDNTLFAFDATLRPFAGVELHGAYLADDLNFSRIGEREGNNNKWALQAGASVGGIVPGATLVAEYTRIEPYVYTHRFVSEGSFYNAYTHNQFGLGHPLGPNADQWLAGARTWLPGGLTLRAFARYARRGESPVDPVTGEITPVGGDVRDGRQPAPFVKEFLSGDLYKGPGAELELLWEPVNSLHTRLFVDWQRWSTETGADLPDRLFARLEASVRL